MKKILIANIGNRNFMYKGLYIQDYINQHGLNTNFYSFTNELWQNYYHEKQHLELTILDKLLDQMYEDIELLILFTSDQPPNTRKTQDTLFAGNILKELIKEKYQHKFEIENIVLKTGITNTNELLRSYRNTLKWLQNEKPGNHVIICDAGGTAQQKSSLKIMTEFLFEEEDYSVLYIPFNGSKQIEEVEQIEYRNIIENEQVFKLIEHGQYLPAFQIRTHFNPIKYRLKNFNFLLEFAHLRFSCQYSDNDKLITELEQNKPKMLQQFPILSDYKKHKCYFNVNELVTENSNNELFFFSEHIIGAQFFFHLKDYTNTVMKLSYAFENLINTLIEKVSGFPFTKNYESSCKKLLNKITNKTEYQAVLDNTRKRLDLNNDDKVMIKLPSQIEYLRFEKGDEMPGLFSYLDKFYPNNPKHKGLGLANLRNKSAHKGEGVSIKKLKEFNISHSLIEGFFQWLELPEINPFEELNTKIKEVFK